MGMKTRLLILIVAVMVFVPALFAQRQDVGTKVLIPSSANTGTFTSLLVVLNLDNDINHVTITSRNLNGNITGTKIVDIPVGGRFRSQNILDFLGAGLGSFGPITVESTNGKLLSAISEVYASFQFLKDGSPQTTGAAGFFPGINVDTAWKLGFIPEAVQALSQPAGVVTHRTNLGLNAVSGVATNVTISLHDENGNKLGNTSTAVPANGMMQLNGIVSTLLTSPPAGVVDFSGYLRIVADQKIIAWASKITNGSNDNSFEIGVAAGPNTPISSFIPETSDPRNYLLFVVLALTVPLLLFLWQRRKKTQFGWRTA